MSMRLPQVINRMEGQAGMIRSLVEGVPASQAAWKPSAEAWSILEVVNHLRDEEGEDFRAHLNMLLHDPQGEWVQIDPRGWVVSRGYNQRRLEESLEGFLAARRESLGWLRSLQAPDWEQGRQAPFGLLRAGDVLTAWAAHDLLHIRQLVELHWAFGLEQSQPFDVRYAGDW